MRVTLQLPISKLIRSCEGEGNFQRRLIRSSAAAARCENFSFFRRALDKSKNACTLESPTTERHPVSESEWKSEDEVVITFGTLQQAQLEAFNNGVRYTLQYLRDEVFGEEITKTDIWTDCFGDGTEAENN